MSFADFKIYVIFLFLALQLGLGARSRTFHEEKPFVILIMSYNNSDWCQRNLDSVFSQNYSNWRIIYVDDCSTDGNADLVEGYIAKSGYADRVTLVKNSVRKLKVENFYYAVHDFCRDDEIVVDLDGDDWWAHPNVLSTLNSAYQNPDVWVTYGNYRQWPEERWCVCDVLHEWVVEQNAYREYEWVTSQQRTFYAWLFKKIRREDLMKRGKFFDMAGDLAYMFPILEMAGGKFRFIQDIIYIYNRANALNDDKKNHKRQLYLDGYIRRKPAYKKIAVSPIGESVERKNASSS